MKTPWGRDDIREAGERLDEHAQPGTGSTDLSGSLAFLYLVDRNSAIHEERAVANIGLTYLFSHD